MTVNEDVARMQTHHLQSYNSEPFDSDCARSRYKSFHPLIIVMSGSALTLNEKSSHL